MGKLAGYVLLAVLSSVLAQDKLLYVEKRGTLLLRPPFPGKITSILWKHNTSLVAEWVKDKVSLLYYGAFNGRTTLDTTTGNLKIINMSSADIGVFSVEINNKVQAERYNAKLIETVPKPVVWVQPLSCTAASENCMLQCEGNTTEAEPVTYSWKMGGGEWMDGEKVRSITNNETTQSVETFTCRMKNPISETESDPKLNPFFREKAPPSSGVGTIVVVVVGCLLLLVAVVFGVWKRAAIKQRFNRLIASGNLSNSDGNNAPVNGQPLSPTAGEKAPLAEVPDTAGSAAGTV